MGNGATDERDWQRVGWAALAVALGAMLLFVTYAFIGTFVLGLFVYYATRPVHTRLTRRLGRSSTAAAVSLVTIALPILLLIGYTIFVGLGELGSVSNIGIDQYLGLLQPYVDLSVLTDDPRAFLASVREDPGRLAEIGLDVNSFREAVSVAAALLSVFASALVQLFLILAFAFYLLRDDADFAAWFRSEIGGEGSAAYAYATAIDRDLKEVYFGNILSAVVVAVVAVVAYNALNLFAPATGLAIPYPTLLGLLTGVGSLVPVVGMKIVYVPVALYLAVVAVLDEPVFLWFPIAFFLVALLLVDTLAEIVLRPYVSGRDLHIGMVLFAYILGPILFGWYGLFLGPLLLVVLIHFVRIILPGLIHGEAITPGTTAPNPIQQELGDPEEGGSSAESD